MSKICKSFCLMMLAASVGSFGSLGATNDVKTEGVAAVQQKKKVTGTVSDDLGPITGAAVVVKGTTNGVVTDMDGNFSLDVSNGETIVVSFLGYTSKEIKYAGEPSLNVKLVEDSQALDEVVVTALGIKKDAKKLGYAVSTIAADDLVKTGTPNFATSLYGKATGVRIQAAPGGSTSAVSINVRGLSSITGNNQPLVIVDGVPVRNGNANSDGYWTDQRINQNGLVDINPEDIESLSILKGASASALYGSEAANGVVMITTKSGKGTQGLGIDFNATLTGDFIAYMPKFQDVFGPGVTIMSRGDYETATGGFWERTYNGQTYKSIRTATQQFGPKYDGSDVLYYDGSIRQYNPMDDYWSGIFRTGFNQTYNLALTQGSEKQNTRFSYTFIDNTPTQYNSEYDKHNFSLVGSMNLSKQLKLDYTANYMRERVKNRPYRMSRITNNFGGMFGTFDDTELMRNMTVTSMGYQNVYGSSETATPDESFIYQPSAYGGLVQEYFWNILGKTQMEDNNRLIASVTPSWQIIDGLTLRGRASTDLTTQKIENMNSTEKPLAFGTYTGSYGLTNKRYEIYYGDILLMYDKDLTDKLGLSAYAGANARTEKVYNASVSTDGGLSVENWFNLNASKNKANASMVKQEFMKTALMGSLTLSWDRYLYLEGTARQEKTSTLAKGNNSFFYPSVNGSFIFTEFMKENRPSWYDYGKVRVSYGIVGNAPDVYRASMAYNQQSTSGYIYNTVSGALGNETIHPEKKYEWEVGLESKFFNDRLGFEVSYYTNTVKDQILETTMPQSAGGTSILLNVGELKNQGLEFSVYGTPLMTKDFRWDLRANLAFNKNKVSKLMDGVDELVHTTLDGVVQIKSMVGESMGDFYAYVPKEDANGNKIVASDGMYEMDFTERVKVGNAMPDATGGFGTSFNYRNLFLDATVDFRIGGDVLNTPYQYMMGRGSLIESLDYRDAAHGGMTYYFENGDLAGKRIATTAAAGPNGEKVYDNGMILDGVKTDGSKNDIIVPSDTYYNETYNWGAEGHIDYSKSIFDNSYVKMRELSLGYNLPKTIVSKFGCRNLSVSVFGRNLFYFYKNLPDFDAEATDATSWISQTSIGGSTATTRSFGFSLRASF